MKKKQSTLPQQQEAIPAADLSAFGQLFVIKDDTLLPEPAFQTDAKFLPRPPMNPEVAADLIFANRAVIFGELTAGIIARSDHHPFNAYLFDVTNVTRPQFLLLSITTGSTATMLSMIALNEFLAKKETRVALVGELENRLKKDKRFAKTMRTLIPAEQEVMPVIEQAVTKNIQGLCIANVDDPEGIWLVNAYKQAHSALLDVMFLRTYRVGKSVMLSVVPPYADLAPKIPAKRIPQEPLTEEEHLRKLISAPVHEAYLKLKAAVLKADASVVFNATKHYVSLKKGRNMAFFSFKQKSFNIVIMGTEEEIVKAIKRSKVTLLADSVKKFWNGECAIVTIVSILDIDEVIDLLIKKIKEKK